MISWQRKLEMGNNVREPKVKYPYPIPCKHCGNDDRTMLEILEDNPGGTRIRCEVCSKETYKSNDRLD